MFLPGRDCLETFSMVFLVSLAEVDDMNKQANNSFGVMVFLCVCLQWVKKSYLKKAYFSLQKGYIFLYVFNISAKHV